MNTKSVTVFFCFSLFLCLKLQAQKPYRVILEQKKAVAVSIKIEGDSNSWSIHKKGSTQSIAGRGEVNEDSLFFQPVIAFQPGETYLIKQEGIARYEFSVPEISKTRPGVVHIYPSSDSLPSNVLKFYIQFSEPMSEQSPYQSLHLVNASGDTLDEVFLKQMPALWNRERTILSLWLDPGRIKRDLELNKRQGAPLEDTEIYSLVIERELKSREGENLLEAAKKEFRTGVADRSKPSVDQWNIDTPVAATKEPLCIYFPEYMDYLSTEGRIEILKNGSTLAGVALFRDSEKSWNFKPEKKWEKGSYTIRADARIEDLAGNNLNKLFDREIDKDVSAEKKYYELKIEINDQTGGF